MTSTALDLWADLERAGMLLSITDGRLKVVPSANLTDSLRLRIKAVLPELIALVAAAPTPDQQAYLDALSPPDFDGAVCMVERWAGPLTHEDATSPVPDVTGDVQKTLFGGKPDADF